MGFVAAGFGGPLSARDREGLGLVLGLLAMQLAGIALQAKFFEYHYGASVPLLAFVAGLGWFKIWRLGARATEPSGGAPGAVAVASLAVVVAMARVPVHDIPMGFWARAKERTKMWLGASTITDRSRARPRVSSQRRFQLGRGSRRRATCARAHRARRKRMCGASSRPSYWLSQRKPASRYVYNVAQRVSWGSEKARSILMADLAQNPPSVIVVQHHDVFGFVTGNELDSHAALPEFTNLATLIDREYSLFEQVEDFDLYRRKQRP